GTFGALISGTAGYMVGAWHVGIGVIDRASGGGVRFGGQSLDGSTTVLANGNSAIGSSAISSSSHFSIGTGDWVHGNDNVRISALYVGKGSGVASGLSGTSALTQALTHLSLAVSLAGTLGGASGTGQN